ncbi:hypothetical protein [Okeania sp. SIO1I7]|nr:hypothetical protein [Okeania sp. SIO1I7]
MVGERVWGVWGVWGVWEEIQQYISSPLPKNSGLKLPLLRG